MFIRVIKRTVLLCLPPFFLAPRNCFCFGISVTNQMGVLASADPFPTKWRCVCRWSWSPGASLDNVKIDSGPQDVPLHGLCWIPGVVGCGTERASRPCLQRRRHYCRKRGPRGRHAMPDRLTLGADMFIGPLPSIMLVVAFFVPG